MSTPRRWLESGDATPEALELLRAGQAPRPLSDAARGRSRRRVAAMAAVPAVTGALAWLPQLALGAVLGAAGTIATMTVLSPSPSPVPAPAVSSLARRATSSAPPASPGSSVPIPGEAASPAPVPKPRPEQSAKPVRTEAVEPQRISDGGLQHEVQLLERARRTLASDPGTARRALLEHEQSFPSGQLRVEREFLMIDACVRLGRRAEAEARARVLEQQAPKTLYGERLDQILRR